MKNIIAAALFLFFLASCHVQQPLANISSVNQADQVDFTNKDNVLIDVRTAQEYNEGHLPDAINIDVNSLDFEDEIKKLDPKKNYYLYCRSGKRSTTATEKMDSAGFKNVANLKDGYINYQKKEQK